VAPALERSGTAGVRSPKATCALAQGPGQSAGTGVLNVEIFRQGTGKTSPPACLKLRHTTFKMSFTIFRLCA
jgi:hypothetical protein